MASKEQIRVSRTPVSGEYHIDVEVAYSKGGANAWTGRQEPRGYWLHVTPLEVEEREVGGQIFTSTKFRLAGGEGRRLFLEEAARFNAKALARLAETCTSHPEYENMVGIARAFIDQQVAQAAAKVTPRR